MKSTQVIFVDFQKNVTFWKLFVYISFYLKIYIIVTNSKKNL